MKKEADSWNDSDPYEFFMGRWSKMTAPMFLEWIHAPSKLSWLDLGCGTGALSEAIYKNCRPSYLCCVDPSPEFLEKTKERLSGSADFEIGSASNIPGTDERFDIVVSGLALNFFPDLNKALSEMKRVVKQNGTVAAYVWDYADRMEFLRMFWDAASEADLNARKLDEGIRFPICNDTNLANTFQNAGLINIETSKLDILTVFKNFEDYWNPFLGGQGPAGSYLVSLNRDLQTGIRKNLQKRLRVEAGGSMKLIARAIAVRGIWKS